MIVQSHEQIYDTIKRGERLVAAESSDPRIYTGGEMPANLISVIPRNGAIEVPSPTAIVKGSPHPNAAKLFAQFNLTPEIQHKFTEEGHHSPRVDVPPPPGLPTKARNLSVNSTLTPTPRNCAGREGATGFSIMGTVPSAQELHADGYK